MTRRRAILLATAAVLAAVDLLHKASVGATYHHPRPPAVGLLMAAVVVALVVFVPRLPSNAAAAGAGIAAGGALGNLVSLFGWSEGVPDPLVLTHSGLGVAFNLADVFALAGDALLLSAAVVHALRNRAALRESV